MANLKKPLVRAVIKGAAGALIMGMLVFLVMNREQKYQSGSLNFSTMSTWTAAALYTSDMKDDLKKGFDAAKSAFSDIEKTCNIYNPESELSRLNATAHETPFACSALLWDILSEARRAYSLSNGNFDVTTGIYTALWKHAAAVNKLPSEAEIKAASEICGLDKAVFDDSAKTVRFTRKGMKIDLGGIAKGYALDLAKKRVTEAGYSRGYIDLGGNVITLPKPPPKADNYTAGVKNPLDTSKTCASVKMIDEAVSTSGGYERFFTIDGRNYAHIISPSNGRPVENVLSVTVVTKKGVDSDILSTAIFAGGKKEAERIAAKMPDVRILMFYRGADGRTEAFTHGEWDYFLPSSPDGKSL